MYQQICSLILIFILLPSCSITKNTVGQNEENFILSQITPDISITYRKDGTFVNYTCETKITHQQINKKYKSIVKKCKEKITQIENYLSSKQISLLFDGGIRNGKDVLKVRALGATMGMIGRPYLYGLGAGGERGVIRALEILHEQLDRTMALCGYRDINTVDRSILKSN